MEIPKRAKKCLTIINELEAILEYYMAGTEELKKIKAVNINFLKEYFTEISESKKLTEIKLAAKIKKEIKDAENS